MVHHGVLRMSYALLTTLGATIVSGPLWQGELPTSWGEWPLTVVVMAFAVVVLRIVFAGFKEKDDKFAERMVAKDTAFAQVMKEAADKHAEAVAKFSETLVQLQTDGHSHGEAMGKSIDRLARVVDRVDKKTKAPRKR